MTNAEMARTLVFASHILIAHREVTDPTVSFGGPTWLSSVRATRGRAEALALAESIARDLSGEPAGFAAAAARYSDDAPTREQGGSLGGLSVLQLRRGGAPVLDALAALREGEVSRVVETQHGFHVFSRRRPPPGQTLNAAHLVIGYDDAHWLREVVPRGTIPSRTRERALELARFLAEQARQAPDQFAALVDRHSEHQDAEVGGDLGPLSNHEMSGFAREIELLSQLPVGGVAGPVDSVFGIEVLQRTAPRQSKEYAMSAIAVRFDVNAPELAPHSRSSALRRAQELAAELRRDPARFDQLQRQHCCQGITRFSDEHQFFRVARALEPLAIGEVGTQPIEAVGQFILPRRAALEKPELPVRFDLDHAGPPDVAYHLSRMAGRPVQALLADVAAQVSAEQGLDAARGARLAQLSLEPWQRQQTREQRQSALLALGAQLEELLGAPGYRAYRALLEGRLERLLLDGSSGS